MRKPGFSAAIIAAQVYPPGFVHYTASPMVADNTSEEQTSRDGGADLLRLATRAAVAVALLLILAKTLAYQATGAVSVLASLVDSLMDAAASLINLVAVRYALTPADREHRFGHGKAESLAALLQSAFILGSGTFLVIEAVQRLLAPAPAESYRMAIGVMLFAIVVTALLIALQSHVIRQTRSAAIRADSLHYRVDLLSNLATLAALALAGLGYHLADPLFALGIAAYLLYSTRDILSDALNELLDRELPDADRDAIRSLAMGHEEVHGVHDLRTRASGRVTFVQLHLEMDDELPLRRAHAIADEVEHSIVQRFPGADVVIHQDPASLVEPHASAHRD